MPRFEQQQVLTGIQDPTITKQQATQELQRAFGQVADFGAKQWEQYRIQDALEDAGEIEYEAGMDLPEASPATAYGQAYNRAAEAGYVAATRNEYVAKLDEFAFQYRNDLDGFNKVSESYRKSMMTNVPSRLRVAIGSDYAVKHGSLSNKIRTTMREETLAQSVVEINSHAQNVMREAANAARANDPLYMEYQANVFRSTVYDPLVAMGELEAAENALAKFNAELDDQLVLGAFEEADKAGNGADFIRDFMDNPPDDLTPDQADLLSRSMTTLHNRRKATEEAAKAELSIEQSKAISDLEIAVNLGIGDPAQQIKQIDNWHTEGSISDSKRTSLLTKLLEGDAKKLKEAQTIQTIAADIDSDEPFMGSQKDLDLFYERAEKPVIDALKAQDPLSASQRIANLVNKTKMIPSQVKREMQAYALSDNPEDIKRAAMFTDMIDDIPGMVEDIYTPEQRAFIVNTVDLMENMQPQEAVLKARELTDPRNQALVDARAAELKDAKTSINYYDVVNKEFDPWFGADLDEISHQQLANEYKALYESYYKAGMSADKAKESTKKTLQRNWGQFNNRIMKYPLNDFYKVAGDTKYIQRQLVKDVSKKFLLGEDVKSEDIILYSDERTARTAKTGQPEYRIAIYKDGSLQMVPAYWKPDVAAEKKRVMDANRKKLNKEATTEEVQDKFKSTSFGGL